MTQRIFKAYDEQDVKELFDLLPDYVKKIENKTNKSNIFEQRFIIEGENFKDYDVVNILAIDWGNLKEIKRPVDYSKYIGKLGWFATSDYKPIIGILKEYNDVPVFKPEECQYWYTKFKPLTLTELKEKNLIAEEE